MRPAAAAAGIGRLLDLTDIEPARSGLQFVTFRATSPRYGQVALRIPRRRVYRTHNDVPVPAARLLAQEQLICGLLCRAGMPVSAPLRLLRAGSDTPVLMSRFVESDGRGPDPEALGAALARLHRLPVPELDLVAHERCDAAAAIAARLRRRWERLHALVPSVPAPPAPSLIAAVLTPVVAGRRSLLHLDVRSSNLLAKGGALEAIVDWSGAMLAHPAGELARLREHALLPGSDIHLPALLCGYGGVAPIPRLDRRTEALLRLDAVSELGLVAHGDAPDRARAAWAASRIRELAAELCRPL